MLAETQNFLREFGGKYKYLQTGNDTVLESK